MGHCLVNTLRMATIWAQQGASMVVARRICVGRFWKINALECPQRVTLDWIGGSPLVPEIGLEPVDWR